MDNADNDYTLHQALEAMAGNASDPQTPTEGEADSTPEPIVTTAHRWQTLFSLPLDTAIEAIVTHRNNLTRTRISPEHWALVRAEKEAEGYDREAYEYELEMQRKKANLTMTDLVPTPEESGEEGIAYLVELTGLLESVEDVRRAARLEQDPVVVSGSSVEDGRAVKLCCIDGKAKANILRWAGEQGGGFEPTILVDPRSLQ